MVVNSGITTIIFVWSNGRKTTVSTEPGDLFSIDSRIFPFASNTLNLWLMTRRVGRYLLVENKTGASMVMELNWVHPADGKCYMLEIHYRFIYVWNGCIVRIVPKIHQWPNRLGILGRVVTVRTFIVKSNQIVESRFVCRLPLPLC